MILNRKYFSYGLAELIDYMSSWHKFHGVLLLSENKPKSRWYRAGIILLKFNCVLTILTLLLGGLSQFSSNSKFLRVASSVCCIIVIDIMIEVIIFASHKPKLKKIIEWCHWTEMRPQIMCKTPQDWFLTTRSEIKRVITFFFKLGAFYGFFIAVLGTIIRSVWSDRRHVPIDINLKGFEEAESWIGFISMFTIQELACIFVANITVLSLTCFILFSGYVKAQLKLVGLFIQNLPLTNPKKMSGHLREITILHLDALRIFDMIDDLYKVSMKMHEILLFLGISAAVFGRAEIQFVLMSIPFYYATFIGFYSFEVEQVIEVEDALRDHYYNLEWYSASVEVRKMILLAMQKPKEVTFGGIFGNDRTSLVRFSETVRQGYDFGLALLKLGGAI